MQNRRKKNWNGDDQQTDQRPSSPRSRPPQPPHDEAPQPSSLPSAGLDIYAVGRAVSMRGARPRTRAWREMGLVLCPCVDACVCFGGGLMMLVEALRCGHGLGAKLGGAEMAVANMSDWKQLRLNTRAQFCRDSSSPPPSSSSSASSSPPPFVAILCFFNPSSSSWPRRHGPQPQG